MIARYWSGQTNLIGAAGKQHLRLILSEAEDLNTMIKKQLLHNALCRPYSSHKKLAKQDRTCPMCFYKLTNPGIAPECWDAFASDDESSGHIEDEHRAIFDCSGYTYARELLKVISHLSASFSTSHNATGWPSSLLGSE